MEGATRQSRLYETIVRVLKKQPIARRSLHQKVGGRWTSDEFNQVVTLMIERGDIFEREGVMALSGTTIDELLTDPKRASVAFVYVVQQRNRDDLVKVGHAVNVQQRLSGLQSGNPHELHAVFQCQFKNAPAVEKAVHRKFDGARQRGEWFAVSAEDAVRAIVEIGFGGSMPKLSVVRSVDASEVRRLAGDGLSQRAIAEALGTSAPTVNRVLASVRGEAATP